MVSDLEAFYLLIKIISRVFSSSKANYIAAKSETFAERQWVSWRIRKAGLVSVGLDYSMSLMAIWYEFGNRGTLSLNASSIDLCGTTQAELLITDSFEPQLVNLFDAGINANSLTFGRIWMTRVNDTQFRIQKNELNFEYRSESSFARNAGTFLGGLIFGRFYESHPPFIPYISRWNYGHGGVYDVEFLGTVTIPR